MTNDNLKVIQSYTEINKLDNIISKMLVDFITKATELVKLSDNEYQIEKTLELNKISIKGYILDSDCCTMLKDNNISNYSLEELKIYLDKYQTFFRNDCSKYYLAISLYEEIVEIEKNVDNKINLEIKKLNDLNLNINDIRNINKNEYASLYNKIKEQLDNNLNAKLIDDKSHNIYILMLNDVFNFYNNEYPNIPKQY